MPGWDNSPRRQRGATIFKGSSPEMFRTWLEAAIKLSKDNFSGEERMVFINAWNEWGEGNHLEPCQKWGRAYLEATRNALRSFEESEQGK
jgi:lipopolysaccharide biosynthesis protein